ncbi:MAG: hypothetical protein CUN55_08435 [Phototrophicales bacterium]|nr:MAG: hypothetical protein CUN55_08435 [Phototrophicales bacterium]
MPTPFTHLIKAQQLLDDERLPVAAKGVLLQELPSFLLGNVAPDAHHMAKDQGVRRETTHFYHYAPQIDPLATVKILQDYPQLSATQIQRLDHRVFVAGYLAHLAIDEIWATEVVYPFWFGEWGDRQQRHFAFTSLMALLDKRDYERMPSGFYDLLQRAEPDHWLPFLPDEALCKWRDVIVDQIRPNGTPQTLKILGQTVYSGYQDLADMVNSPQRQEIELWSHFPKERVASVEHEAYEHMLRVVCDYLQLC